MGNAVGAKGAVRPPGRSTGVYTTLPGQNAKLHCTVTVGRVIPGRNRKSRGRTFCDEGEKTFSESMKICKEKDSHNRS